MANHKSAIKRHRQSLLARARNRAVKTRVRNVIKAVRAALVGGDVATAEALAHVRAITPVPGGVGPMTIACLLRTTLVAAQRRAGVAVDTAL